jgi:hypothetical protein
VEPAFRPFQPTQNPEAERVEQAFRPAVSVGKMPALAAEVLFDHSPQRPNHRVDPLCHPKILRSN